MKRRTLALLLCAALVFSLFGCTQEPAPTQTTAPPETEPPGLTAYNESRAAVDSAAALTLRITEETTTSLRGETFTTESNQTLRYAGLGTDALMISSEQDITYGDIYDTALDEIWSGNTLYMTLDEEGFFSGTLSAEEVQGRYLPPVLLNGDLYEEITLEELESHSTVTFAAPTAGESWAMPASASLVDASGSVLLSTEGALQKANYSISYIDGEAEVRKDVEMYIEIEPVEISIPENTADYIALEDPDAVLLAETAMGRLLESTAVTISSTESLTCEAGGVMRNQSTTTNTYGSGDEMIAKFETSISLMDYSTGQSQSLDQEELYLDGKYTVTTDGDEPQVQSGVTKELVLEYTDQLKNGCYLPGMTWKSLTVSQLDSGVSLLEFTLDPEEGALIEDGLMVMLFNDAAFLDNYASAYVTNALDGYIAIDQATGLPTSLGYYFEGVHTIEGQDYLLSMQVDQAVEAPSRGAYHAITDEMLPEEEPETKTTPLFYHVTGEDGQEMWLFGTIHVGDARTAYLPQEIYDAFAASDALALEFDSTAFEEEMKTDDALMAQVSQAYFYTDGTQISQHIDQDLYEKALPYLKASGNYNMNAKLMRPALWSSLLENFLLRQSTALHSDQGLEARLQTLAQDQEKPIYNVESGLFQIQMIAGYSDDLQEMLLDSSISAPLEEYGTELMDLYEKWCAGDEAVLREALLEDLSELTEEELVLHDEYNTAMIIDRNSGMLEVAIGYLESGETVFYAVGLAHLLCENGLVDTLREAGYTVELVTFG